MTTKMMDWPKTKKSSAGLIWLFAKKNPSAPLFTELLKVWYLRYLENPLVRILLVKPRWNKCFLVKLKLKIYTDKSIANVAVYLCQNCKFVAKAVEFLKSSSLVKDQNTIFIPKQANLFGGSSFKFTAAYTEESIRIHPPCHLRKKCPV